MSTTSVLTVPIGTSTIDRVRFDTATALDGSLRIAHTAGKSAYTASSEINVSANQVVVPSVTYTAAAGGVFAGDLSVTGATTLQSLAAESIVASTKFVSNTYNARDPLTDTMVVTAKTVRVNGDVEITGSLDTLASQVINVQDKIVTLGAVDADEDGVADTTDVVRDGSGIVIPGVPVNMPAGADPALYEHSIKWMRNGGDFNVDGSDVAPQNKPVWEINGGALCITGVDHVERQAQFFFAPHFVSGVSSLGLYYTVGDGRVKLVQSFSADEFPVV
jgi:hypothetical protein